MFDYRKSLRNREGIEKQIIKVNEISRLISSYDGVLLNCVEKLLDGLNTEISTKPEYLSSENILKSYLALHEGMQALEPNEPLHLRLELEIVFAIARQYTALKDYRLSSFYLGYAYQLINKLNLLPDELTKERDKIDTELQLQQTLYVYHTFFSPNEPLANRQLRNWYSFGRETEPYFLGPYQLLQLSLFTLTNFKATDLEDFIENASHPSSGAKVKDNVVVPKLTSRTQRITLNEARQAAIAALENKSVEEAQKTWSEIIRACIKELCDEVKQELGEPYGWKFCLLSLGSLSRDEACLRSDIEFALLCEEIEGRAVDAQARIQIQRYFQVFVELLELKIIALGETNELLFEKEEVNQNKIKNALRALEKQYGTRDAIPENVKAALNVDNTANKNSIQNIGAIKRRAKRGLQFDEQGNYPFGFGRNYFGFLNTNPQAASRDDLLRFIQPKLLSTSLIKEQLSKGLSLGFSGAESDQIHINTLLDATYLCGDTRLAQGFIAQREKLLKQNYIENSWNYQQFLGFALSLSEFVRIPKINSGGLVAIKEHLQFMQWTVKSLALYYDIKERNTIKRIQGLVKENMLHPYIGALLTQVIEVLFQARLRAHHYYGSENDILYLSEQADESLFSLRQFPSGIRILKEFPIIYSYLNILLGNWQTYVKQKALSGMQVELGRELMQDGVPYEVDIVFNIYETLLQEAGPLTSSEMLLQLPLYLSREEALVVPKEELTKTYHLQALKVILRTLFGQNPSNIQKAYYQLLISLGMAFKLYFNLPIFSMADCFNQAAQREHLSPELAQWLLNTLGWLGELRARYQEPTEEEQQRWLQLSACLKTLAQALKQHIDACIENLSKLDELITDYMNQSLVKASNPEECANWFVDVTRFLLYTQAPIAVHRHFYNKLPRALRPNCLAKAKDALDSNRDSWWEQSPMFWEQLWDAPDEAGNRPSYETKQQQWQTQLSALLCEKSDIIKETTKIYIHSLTLANHALSPEMTIALIKQGWLDVHGAFTKKATHPIASRLPGNHLVIPWPLPDDEKIKTILSQKGRDEKTISSDILKEVQATAQFYLKVYPEYPLVELFLHDLGRRLGYFTPRFVDVWLWQSGESHYPILVSEAVPGQTLQQVLDTQQRTEFNRQAFNESVALNALVRLEDNKPDNVIIRSTDYGQQLVLVDADRWFVPAFKGNQLHAKDITFCLDEMNLKIDSIWREEFLSLNPEVLLTAWVDFLKTSGEGCQEIFGSKIEDYFNDDNFFNKRKPEEKTLLLPPLKLAVVTELFENIQRLQFAIEKHSQLNLFQLVACIEPRLANHYGRAHQEKLGDAHKRFAYVAGHAYLSGKGGLEHFPSKINFKTHQEDMWQSLLLIKDKPKDIRAAWAQDIQLAEKELEGISETPKQLEETAELIRKNNLQRFQQLNRHSKEKVLDRLEGSILSEETQQALLSIVQNELGWEHLKLDGMKLLKNQDLEIILQKSPNLKTLQVFNCNNEKLTGSSLVNYIKMDCNLRKITVNGIKKRTFGRLGEGLRGESCLPLPNLEKLEISDSFELTTIHIQAPVLAVMKLSNLPKLRICRTQSEKLSYLEFKKSDNLLPEEWHQLARKDSYNSNLHTALIKPNASSRHAELIQQFPFLLNIDFGTYHNFIYSFEIKQCAEVLARYDVDKKALNTAEKQAVTALVITLLEQIKFLKETLVKPLLKALGDKDSNVRAAAARALGELKQANPSVIQALLTALGKKGREVRAAAADALVKLGHENPSVIQALLTALGNKDWRVRAAAAGTLGELKQANPDVIESLLVALRDKDSFVCAVAARALGELKQANPDVIQALLKALRDEYFYIRAAAARALGELKQSNPEVIQALLTALGDKNWNVRKAAPGALVKLGHENPGVIQALLAALRDKDRDVRADAASALGELKQAHHLGVIQALLVALGDWNDDVRVAAEGALVKLGHENPDVIQALLAALGDEDWRIRRATARALGELKQANSAVIQALLKALKETEKTDPDGFVRADAASALGELKQANPAVIQALLKALEDKEYYVRTTTAAAGTLVKLGYANPDIIEGLLAALGDEDWRIRRATARVLGELKQANPAVIQALLKALKETETDAYGFVRIATARALGELKQASPDVIEGLLVALRDKDRDLRATAAGALGKLKQASPAVIQALLAALGDKEWGVRAATAGALVKLGHENPGVIEGLLAALRDKDWRVRAAAAGALDDLVSASFKFHFSEFDAAIQTLVEKVNARLEREHSASIGFSFAANPFGMFAHRSITEKIFNDLFKVEKTITSTDEELMVEPTSNIDNDFEPTTMRKTK